MPNNWNNIIPGITQGLQNLGAGFIQKADRNDAQKLYEGIGGNYDKINKLRDKAINVVLDNGTINQPEYKQGGVIIDNTMPVRPQTQTQEDPSELIKTLYQDIVKKTGELNRNPYGKDYMGLIDKFYGQGQTKYDIVSSKNGTMYAIDPYNPSKKITIEEATPKTEKWVQVPGSKSFTSEEDGKYYVTQMKQSPDGETKLVKTELSKEDYESWKNYNPTYEDKKDIDMNYNINLKSGLNDLGLLFKNSGKKGNGSSTQKLSELDKMAQDKLMSWNKNIYMVDSVYGGDITKAPQTIQDAISKDYEYLKAQNVSDDDLKFYKSQFQTEGKISKQDIKKVNDKRLKSYELEFGGKGYDVLNKSSREQLISAIKNAMTQNQLSSDDILEKFNAIRGQLPPQVYQLIVQYFSR